MQAQTLFRRLGNALIIISIGLVVSGTKACREDYCVGCDVAVGTPTVTPTGTVTDDGDDETGTPTPTPTLTVTPTGTVSPSPTPTPTVTVTVTVGTTSLRRASLSDSSPIKAAPSGKNGNWLGKLGASFKDTDADGFTDAREEASGTDPKNPSSYPKVSTSLASRIQKNDIDADGLSGTDEQRLGTDPTVNDSDGDTCLDGAEILSGTNPLDAMSRPVDSDGDCLSDEYEKSAGLDASHADTDRDMVRDDVELMLGLDPFSPDTDEDGVLDWKEIQLGSDPSTPDF